MDNALKILVIIISSVLGIFLLLAIWTLVRVNKAVKSAKDVANKAGIAVDDAKKYASNLKGFVGPALISRFILGKVNKKK